MANAKKTLRIIEDKLDKQASRANLAQAAAILLGGLIIALLLWNFNRAAGVFEDSMRPEEVANYVTGEVTPKVEGIHVQADEILREHVPVMVDDFITNVVKNQLPEMRQQFQTSLQATSKEELQKYENQIYSAVDQTMTTYSSQIRAFATELASADGSKGFEDALYNMLNDSLKTPEMSAEMDGYGMALEDVSTIFDRLHAGKDLNLEEQALARLIAVTREISSRVQPNLKAIKEHAVLGIDAP